MEQTTQQASGRVAFDDLAGEEVKFLVFALGYDRSTIYKVLTGSRENALIDHAAQQVIALRASLQAARKEKITADKEKTEAARSAARIRRKVA